MPQSRYIHITENQKEILLGHMCKNPELNDNKWYKANGREKYRAMWEELTEILNSQELGAKKDPSCWKDTWTGWKNKIKVKALKIMAFMHGEPGTKAPPSPLTDIEKRLLVFMGEGALIGEKNIQESQPVVIVKSLPGDSDAEMSFQTIECTIDAYELNSGFEEDSDQQLTSAQPNDSGAQPLNNEESGLKRRAVDKHQGAKRLRCDASGHLREPPAPPSLEERTLAAAEETARSMYALVALCERYADAAERTAGAAERRARAAERMADAAERQALVAENAARKATKY